VSKHKGHEQLNFWWSRAIICDRTPTLSTVLDNYHVSKWIFSGKEMMLEDIPFVSPVRDRSKMQ